MTCPSELALEEHLLDPAHSKSAAHVLSCAACGARLARMEEQGRDFRQYVYPATLAALEAGPARTGRGRLLAWLTLPAGALAAAAVAVIALRGPPADYEGAKGAALKLSLYTPKGLAAEGARIPAASVLRIGVQTSAACTLMVVSVDASGEVSPLAGPLALQGERTLPGGLRLDGKPGLERFFAICSPEEVPAARLAAMVRSAARDLRTPRPLADLPAGTTQATVLLEKMP